MSDEEFEWRADHDLESNVKRQSMNKLWEAFPKKPKAINAKKLWIYFTEIDQRAPREVEAMVLKDIKKQVESDQQSKNTFEADQLFSLLHIAKTNSDYFWQLLHRPNELFFGYVDSGNQDILEILRKWLPERRDIKQGDLDSIFDELDQRKNNPPNDLPFLPKVPRECFTSRYKRWKIKNIPPDNR